jgi:glutamyl endopeptidase
MLGRVRHKQSRRIYYSIDTYGGQSGSPVYTIGPYAVGIHAYSTLADDVDGQQHNSATRIFLKLFNTLEYWKRYPLQ